MNDANPELYRRSMHEEFVNAVTHALGLALSLAAAAWLMTAAVAGGEPWRVAGCAIYAASMVAVYAASTLSHAVRTVHLRRRLRILDQALIYLMIAGTYTPFGFTYLRGGYWWVLTAAMWLVAWAGVVSKTWFGYRVEAATAWSYVLLGWLPIMAVKPLLESVPTEALRWMLAGGLCYTFGTVFLSHDTRVKYFHAIWHLLVIAGSTCHLLAIYWYVARQTAG
ncbi:MAG TPA: hemolysin III family protein [Pirellulales bacterium]|jgi:hemolysin III|nr:hemolysin III family protein [Pirellulales bacterium]